MTHTVAETRSHNYFRQVKGSLLFKGLSLVCSFLAIPLMIHYLGQELFGVWSTMLSLVTWVTFFDLGLGNGLRNKLAESLAKERIDLAQTYISSAYSLIGLLALTIFILLAFAAFIVPWQSVFNTRSISAQTLSYAVLITVFFIALNFWASLINPVLNAVQKTEVVVMGQSIVNAMVMILVYALYKATVASLPLLAAAYGLSLLGASITLSLWFYSKHAQLAPVLLLDFSHIRPLINLGTQFFVIQIAVLVIFTSDKILITQLFGPETVTPYEVTFRLFSIITLLHSLISAPLWSAYTDAYHRRDYAWISSVLKAQITTFVWFMLGVIVLAILADPLINLWIGSQVVVLPQLVASIALFVAISVWNNVFAHFLNGIGEIKLQLYTAIWAMLINIPLSIYLTRYVGFGVNGIVIATCLSLSIFAITGPYQTYTLLKGKGG